MAIHYDHALDRTFHALGDGTRRAMLGMLARRGECTAGELGNPFEISQPTVSKHLGVLERAGLLSRRVDGRVHHFRLEMARLNEIESWLGRHQGLWQISLARLGGVLDDVGGGGGGDGGGGGGGKSNG